MTDDIHSYSEPPRKQKRDWEKFAGRCFALMNSGSNTRLWIFVIGFIIVYSMKHGGAILNWLANGSK